MLCGAARALRDSSAILSVLVRNRAGEVFKAAIQAGDLAIAENNLTAEWAQESLYGGRVRLFTPDSLQAMLKEASLEVIAERGVRVLADYLPPRISRSAEYERIFELERKLGVRPEYAAVARYTQCFARFMSMNNVADKSSSTGSGSSGASVHEATISLGLGLTNECNLACSFCYRDPASTDRLSLDQVKSVMERLPIRSVNLGTGENGMHPEFKAILGLPANAAHQTHDYFQRPQCCGFGR